MSNLNRGPSIDASYQVSVHLAKPFQRRSFFLEIHRNDHLNLHYVGTMLIQVSYVTLIPTGNLIS